MKKNKNLSQGQLRGLRELTENPDITIQKADKGSAVVVMNTTDYLRKGYRQLSDSNFYTKLDHDPTLDIGNRINDTLLKMRQQNLISDKNLEYLSAKSCSEGRFYLLSKVHKKGVPGIRDTQDFIFKIKELCKIPEGALLCPQCTPISPTMRVY